MTVSLPYVNGPNNVSKILEKIKEAKTPDRFTQDFLATILGFRGGNNRQFIPLAKKLGLLNSDGTPTDLYKRYRNSQSSKAAVAQAIRNGYRELFQRNEYAYQLTKEQLKGLVVEITGLDAKDRVVQLICQTFEVLRGLADFDTEFPQDEDDNADQEDASFETDRSQQREFAKDYQDFGLNLSYTINLVLPKTDDPAVFNAIFRSLRENLLRK
jgi:Family of unknown function (DUF5343)